QARQRRAQGVLLLAHRQALLVAARDRPVGRAALAPLGVADVARAGAARPLLAPELLARARDLGARLRLVRTAPQAGEVGLDRLMDEVLLVRIAEHLVGELDLAHPLVVEVLDRNLHRWLLAGLIPAWRAGWSGTRSSGPAPRPARRSGSARGPP